MSKRTHPHPLVKKILAGVENGDAVLSALVERYATECEFDIDAIATRLEDDVSEQERAFGLHARAIAKATADGESPARQAAMLNASAWDERHAGRVEATMEKLQTCMERLAEHDSFVANEAQVRTEATVAESNVVILEEQLRQITEALERAHKVAAVMAERVRVLDSAASNRARLVMAHEQFTKLADALMQEKNPHVVPPPPNVPEAPRFDVPMSSLVAVLDAVRALAK
jgi:hypothetical protein